MLNTESLKSREFFMLIGEPQNSALGVLVFVNPIRVNKT